MTIAVGFEDGTFTAFDPSYLASPWGWLQGVAASESLAALVERSVTRARRLRDEPGPADDHRRVHAAGGCRRPRERRAARPDRQGDPGRGARAGGRRLASGSSKASAGSAAATSSSPNSSIRRAPTATGACCWTGSSRRERRGSSSSSVAPTRGSRRAAQGILKAADAELDRRGLRRTVPAGSRALAGARCAGRRGVRCGSSGSSRWTTVWTRSCRSW